MGEINQQLCILIKEAQGERGQNQFAQQCGISSSAITRIFTGSYVPSAKTLQKIASKAYNGVTYEMLMNAAGYLTTEQEEKSLANNGEANSDLNIPEKYSGIRVALNEGDKNLTQDDIDDIVRFIEFTANKNKK